MSGKSNWINIFVLLGFIVIIIGCLILGYLTFLNYKEIGWEGYLRIVKLTVKSYGIMTLIAISLVLIVAFLTGIQALFNKWRKIRLFISYHHVHQDIVLTLKAKLKTSWIDVRFIPFELSEHDNLISRIDNEIRKSDVLVVLPGIEKSFVDAEILAARSLRKIVIFLKIKEEQTTPDTALKGYPVFDFNKLEKCNFYPFVRFIYYTNKLWKDTLQNFLRVTAGFVTIFFDVFFVFLFSGCIIGIATDIIGAFNLDLQMKISIYYGWTLTVLASLFFCYSYFMAIYQRLRAIKIARQKIITGELTYEYLNDCLMYLEKDREILETLNEGSLPLRH